MLGLVGYHTEQEERPVGRYIEPFGTGKLLSCHESYLASRKISKAAAKTLWQLKGIGPDGGSYAWRIFIPIIHHGKSVSWTTRAVGQDREPRYMTAKPEQEEISHRDLLFGADYVRHAAIVCEGPMDAMRIGPGAVSTLGIGVSEAQINLIAKYPIRAICFDSEERAQRKAREIARRLEVMDGQTFSVELSTGKDPSSASAAEIKKLRAEFLGE
jgi:DNA primase